LKTFLGISQNKRKGGTSVQKNSSPLQPEATASSGSGPARGRIENRRLGGWKIRVYQFLRSMREKKRGGGAALSPTKGKKKGVCGRLD